MFKFILVRNEFSQILSGTEIRYSQNQIFGNPIKPNFSETNIPARILFHFPLRTYSFSFFNSSLLFPSSSSSHLPLFPFFFFSNFQLLQHQPLRNIPFLPSPSFSSFAAVSFDRPRVHTHTHTDSGCTEFLFPASCFQDYFQPDRNSMLLRTPPYK